MTEREALPDSGFDSRHNDPYEDDGWFGRAQVIDPMAVDEILDPPPPEPRYDAPRPATGPAMPRTREFFSPSVSAWTVNGQLRPSSSTLTFRAPPPPWYRTKAATIALVAAAGAAVLMPLVLLASPDSSSTDPEQSASTAPRPSTTVSPTPRSVELSPTNAPPPLPPPPPPPPPEETGSAPTYNQPDWTRSATPSEEKPDIGVTRTPVTRAPISVAPQPRQPSDNNSATPGDGRKRGCGGWC